MSKHEFSFFKGPISNTKPDRVIDLANAMEMIKKGVYAADIEKMRSETNPTTRKTLKNCLPYITFSGTFSKRANEALRKHSGLMVLDFDGLSIERLEELKSQVCTIEWVCAVWVSPSGNGLKVLVKINENWHLESFVELSDFFVANFSLDLDKSGKDVSRSCFVSADKDLYFNPDSAFYSCKASESMTKAVDLPRIIANHRQEPDDLDDFQSQRKRAKDLARVAYVVEQIEKEGKDITADYDDWQTIAFALAILGEDAREYFHRVSKMNSEYEVKATDDKFSDALAKGRGKQDPNGKRERGAIKTPAKFFTIAKDYGVRTQLPSTIQEAQKAAEAKQVIGDDDQSNDYVKYGIYLNKDTGTYWSLDLKGIPREISNFNLRILYHINTGADEAYRLMQIRNIFGLDKILRINTDDFVSAGSFKKVIARIGNFIWKGMDHDLTRLQDMLQRHERHTEMVNTLGWNKKHKFYSFANGLFDTVSNTFHPIDDYGIVEKVKDDKKINFFIPALSKVFADKDDLFANEKKFIYVNGKSTYTEWASQYVKVYGDNGRIGLVFWVCALFSDVLFRSMGLRMPMPFSYGKRGSGKGSMTQSITRMWGEKQDQIMLGGATTVVGFMRKMAQFSNGLVWLDEYKNNLPIKVIESIKNLFDRIGYERGKKDNGFTTESTPILSAVWLSGQEMPTVEPALFTRCILMTFTESTRTEEQRQEYRKLQRMEDDGLSHLTMNFLSYRGLFESDFQEVYEGELREFSKYINNNDVDERLQGNYAMLLATAKIMDGLGMLPFSYDEFKAQCRDMVMNQYFILRGSDDTSKFWQVVEQLVSSYILKDGEHYILANGFIYIYVQDVYHHYVKAMNDRREVNILDKSTLENYLKSDTKSFVARKKKSIGQKYSWAMQFKYKELDIDLIRGTNENEIREKYAEMQMDYETEKPAKVDDGFGDGVQIEADFTIKN